MSGTSNFLVFDSNQQNMMNDINYLASTYRQNGTGTGIAPSDIHNKLYYQTSIMSAALGAALAAKGFTVSDSSLATLTTVLSNLTVAGDLAGYLALAGGTMTGDLVLHHDPVANLEAATKQYVVNNFAPSGYGLGAAAISFAGSFDLQVVNGYYITAGTGQTNAPASTEKFYLDVTASSVTYVAQQAIGQVSGNTYTRVNNNGIWTSWVQMATTTSANPAGTIIEVAQNAAPTGYIKANGAAVSRSTYASLFAALVKSATVTISIASPGVITWNGHGLSANDPVKFTTTGALPTGLVTATTYYVVGASITTNTFQLSATAGGAAINTTGTQSGVHTAINAPWGDGDGSTTFNVPDLRGEFIRGWDDSRAVDANRSFGSQQADEYKSHYHDTGDSGTGALGSMYVSGKSTILANARTATSGGAETRPRNVALLRCIKY